MKIIKKIIALDKLQHLIVGYALFCASLLISNITIAMVIVVTAAISKELWDSFHRKTHTPELMDILATIAGALPMWGYLLWIS